MRSRKARWKAYRLFLLVKWCRSLVCAFALPTTPRFKKIPHLSGLSLITQTDRRIRSRASISWRRAKSRHHLSSTDSQTIRTATAHTSRAAFCIQETRRTRWATWWPQGCTTACSSQKQAIFLHKSRPNISQASNLGWIFFHKEAIHARNSKLLRLQLSTNARRHNNRISWRKTQKQSSYHSPPRKLSPAKDRSPETRTLPTPQVCRVCSSSRSRLQR